MTECDSAIFAGWGYGIVRSLGSKEREAYNKFIDTIGMKRSAQPR